MSSTRPYLRLARPDHWFKNIFGLPGIVLGWAAAEQTPEGVVYRIIGGVASLCLISSANYLINEVVDAEFDKFHPEKKNRPSIVHEISRPIAAAEYVVLGGGGLGLALVLGRPVFWWMFAFLVSGWAYNLWPIRTKDIPIVDVLSESINNPLRFLIGWYSVSNGLPFPPSSLLLGYWMSGAFLMALKRYAEYRSIGAETARLYRRSFVYYNEERLLVSTFYYVMASGLFLGVFLIKYKIELLFTMPLVAGVFAWYAHLAFRENSPVQHPERLYRQRGFLAYCLLTAMALVVMASIRIPMAELLTVPLFQFPSAGP